MPTPTLKFPDEPAPAAGDVGRWPRVLRWLAVPLIAVAYLFAAKLGLSLAFDHGSVSPVWPPTGVALAALLLVGWRVWPAVLAGAFLANALWTGVPWFVALVIGAGNTLEAIAGVWMIQRFCGGRDVFDRPWTIARYVLLAAPLAVAISATIGVSALVIGGTASAALIGDLWLTWWLGDLVGAVLVAPLLVIWLRGPIPVLNAPRFLEALALATLTVGIAALVFAGLVPRIFDREVFGFLVIPPLVWAAFRFGRRGAIAAAFIVSVLAIGGTLAGHGPYFRGDTNNALLVVQAFTGVITVTALIIAAVVLHQQQTDLSLRHSEERHRALNEAGSDVVWTFQPETGYTEERGVRWWLTVTGQTVEDAARGGWLQAVHEDDRARVEQVWANAKATCRPYEIEYRVMGREGDVRHVLASAVPILNANGRVREWCGALTDITARRRAEEAQRETLQGLDVALRAGRMGAWEWDINSGRVTWSPHLEALHGMPTGSFGGRMEDFQRDIHPDDRQCVMDAIQRVLREGGEYVVQYRIIDPEGEIKWLEARGDVFRNGEGKPVRMAGVCADVTRRVLAERQNAASQRQLTDLFENATVGIHLVGSDGTILRANRAELDMLGYEPHEYIGQPIARFHCDNQTAGDILRRLERGETLCGVEANLRCKDGTIKTVLIDSSALFEDGTMVHTRCFTRDITARKLVERRAAAEHAIGRALIEATSLDEAAPKVIRQFCEALDATIGALWVPDEHGASLVCRSVWNCSPSAVQLAPFLTMTRHIQFACGMGLPGRAWATGKPASIENLWDDQNFPRRDAAKQSGLRSGHAFPILVGRELLGVFEFFTQHQSTTDQHLCQMMTAIGHEIAQFIQRTRAEEALRASEARERARAAELQTIIDAVPAIVWVAHDPECKLITGNRAAQDFLRLDYQANASYTAPADQRPRNFRIFKDGVEVPGEELPVQRAARTGQPVLNEALDVVFDDGEVRHERGNVIPLFNESGAVRGALAAFLDLTPMKRAENALQLRLQRLQLLYQLADAVARATDVSPIYKQSLQGLMDTLDADRASILLSDADGVMRFKAWEGLSDGYRQAVEGHSPWKPDEPDPQPVTIEDVAALEHLGALREVVLGEGIHALAFIPLIADGRLIGKFMFYFNRPHQFTQEELQIAQTIAGHVAFAIERVCAQAQLHASERLARRRLDELAAIYRHAPVGLCFVDAELKFIKVNDRLAELHGLLAADHVGRTVEEVAPSLPHLAPLMRQALRTGEPVSCELSFAAPIDPETIRDWFVTYQPVKDPSGHVIGINGMVQDITDRKRIQRELELHRNRLEELVAHRTVDLERTHQRLRQTERMASMGTLAAGLGHDMGNLLLPVRSRLDVLRTLADDSKVKEHLDAIDHCVTYLNDLVRGLRLFARDPDENTRGEATDLCQWVQQTQPFYHGLLPRQIELSFDLEPGLPQVQMAPHALTQAVLNLVNNAREAIGDAKGHVQVRARRAPSFSAEMAPVVALSVIDDGPGMTPEVRARAVEPFFTTKTRSLSTGLGLAMVYGLVGAAEGMLEIHSPPRESLGAGSGRGTEITLLIPVAIGSELSGLADSGPRAVAAISVSSARSRALLTSLLDSMGYVVNPDANGDPGCDSTIWFTEPHPEQFAAAQQFIQQGDRKLIIVGEAPAEWTGLTERIIDATCKPSKVKEALRR